MKVLKLLSVLVCLCVLSMLFGCGSSSDSGSSSGGEPEVYPKLYCMIADDEVEVWQAQGVTDEQMEAFVDMLDDIYRSELNSNQRTAFKNNINRIEVRVSGNINHIDDNLFVSYNATLIDIVDYLLYSELIYLAPPQTPQDQSEVIDNLFGIGIRSATVKGYMTETQWTGVANKIKSALNEAYETGSDARKNRFVSVFYNDCEIIVEITPVGYTKWKTTTDGRTMYLAFDKLNNDLLNSIALAVVQMEAGTASSE